MFKRINDKFSPSSNTLRWMNRCRMKEMRLGGMNREGLRTENTPHNNYIDVFIAIIIIFAEIGTAIWVGDQRSYNLGYSFLITWGFIFTIISLDLLFAYLHIIIKSRIKILKLENKIEEYENPGSIKINQIEAEVSTNNFYKNVFVGLIFIIAAVKIYFTQQSFIGDLDAERIIYITSFIYLLIAFSHVQYTGYAFASMMTKISYLRDTKEFRRDERNDNTVVSINVSLDNSLDYTGLNEERVDLKSLSYEKDSSNDQTMLWAKGLVSDEEIELVYHGIKNRTAQLEFAYASLKLQLIGK